MRNKPDKNKSFREFLEEVKENALKDYENQDYQFEELVNKLDLNRKPGRTPLVDTVFILQHLGRTIDVDREKTRIPDLKFKRYENEMGITKFDLILAANDVGEPIKIWMIYSTTLFKRASIEKMIQRYVNILEQVIEKPDILLKEIEISHELLVAGTDVQQETQADFTF
jgi:non-ribosomal peptide synthetase component F